MIDGPMVTSVREFINLRLEKAIHGAMRAKA